MVEYSKYDIIKELDGIIDYVEQADNIPKEHLIPEWVKNKDYIMIYRYGYIFLEMSYLIREVLSDRWTLTQDKAGSGRLLLEMINSQKEDSIIKCLKSLIYNIYVYELEQDMCITADISGMSDLMVNYMIEEGILQENTQGDSDYEEEEEKWDLEPTKSEALRLVESILNDCINGMGNSLYLSEENELKPDKYLLSPRASYIMYELACYLVSGIRGEIKVIDPTIFIDIAEYFEAKSKLDIEEFKDSIKMYLYNIYIYKRHIDSKYRICMGYNGMDYLMYRILRCDN